MKTILQNTNPQFKGFKNLISHSTGNFTYMAMQLNNDGKPDLDIWKGIQKDFLNKEKPDDHIIFHCIKEDKQDHLFTEDIILDIEHIKEGTFTETWMLRTYDLIASITKRIIEKDYIHKDKNLYETLMHTLNNLTKRLNNKSLAEHLSEAGAREIIKPSKAAEIIQLAIIKKMKEHFKL